jgi:hypothetical protein
MSEVKNWLFLDGTPHDQITGFTVRQMANEINSQGNSAKILKLFKKGQELDPTELYNFLKENCPHYIVWDGGAGWKYWDVIKLCQDSVKISLFFDDPIRAIEGWGVGKKISEASLQAYVFVWDPYWKDQVMLKYGCMAHDINLAATPSEYYDSDINLTDDPVFIGNLHGSNEINRTYSAFPNIFKKAADECTEYIRSVKGRIPSQDMTLFKVLSSWSESNRRLWDEIVPRNTKHERMFQWYLWVYSKNEARKRMLKRILAISPVRMFSETQQLNHASIDEIRSILGEYGERLKISDTGSYNYKTLGQLYHYGPLQLEAVDPQSVYTGIPYRVFQTAASGRVLLTDGRSRWNEHFKNKEHLIIYDDLDLENVFLKTMQDKDLLKQVGKQARTNFVDNHTWSDRIEYIQGIAR